MPVYLHGAYFVSFLLLTERCYDAETSVILVSFRQGFSLICFLKSFGEVIVSSKFEETKGYSPGVFFLGSEKMC